MNLLGGLGSDYNAVVTAINIRDDKISVEAIHSMLLTFENRLEQQSSAYHISTMTVNCASSSNNRGGGRRYNGSRGHSYSNFTPNTNNYNYRSRGREGRYTQNGRHNSINPESHNASYAASLVTQYTSVITDLTFPIKTLPIMVLTL